MDGGGRRQLPSWMMKSAANEQAGISGTIGGSKEDGSVETLPKAVKPRKKFQAKKDDLGIPSTENKPQLLKECQARTRKRKSQKLDEVEGERFQEDEAVSLKPCKESRKTRLSDKHGENRVDGFLKSHAEKKVVGIVKRRVREDAPRKKRPRKSEEVDNERAESGQSEDELTVEDLISIAEEYVKADREEFQKSRILEIESVKKPLPKASSDIGLEKTLTSHSGTSLVTDHSLSSDSSSTQPLSSKGSIINQSTTIDPARDMLELFLGPWLAKSKEVEMKTDPINEKTKFDYELRKRSESDNDAKVAPAAKKKFSLKDNVGKLLD